MNKRTQERKDPNELYEGLLLPMAELERQIQSPEAFDLFRRDLTSSLSGGQTKFSIAENGALFSVTNTNDETFGGSPHSHAEFLDRIVDVLRRIGVDTSAMTAARSAATIAERARGVHDTIVDLRTTVIAAQPRPRQEPTLTVETVQGFLDEHVREVAQAIDRCYGKVSARSIVVARGADIFLAIPATNAFDGRLRITDDAVRFRTQTSRESGRNGHGCDSSNSLSTEPQWTNICAASRSRVLRRAA